MSEPHNQCVLRDWDPESIWEIMTVSAVLICSTTPVTEVRYLHAGVVEFKQMALYLNGRQSGCPDNTEHRMEGEWLQLPGMGHLN